MRIYSEILYPLLTAINTTVGTEDLASVNVTPELTQGLKNGLAAIKSLEGNTALVEFSPDSIKKDYEETLSRLEMLLSNLEENPDPVTAQETVQTLIKLSQLLSPF